MVEYFHPTVAVNFILDGNKNCINFNLLFLFLVFKDNCNTVEINTFIEKSVVFRAFSGRNMEIIEFEYFLMNKMTPTLNF